MSKTIHPVHHHRLNLVRAEMAARKLDAYLIFDRMDQYWLTGFNGEDGGVLITPTKVTLITDGRFSETADREAAWAKKVIRIKRGPDSYAKVIKSSKAAKVGFEPTHLNVYNYSEIAKLTKPQRLVSAAGLIAKHRAAKMPHEVDAIRRGIRIAQDAFEAVRPQVKVGVTESWVAARLEFEMKQRGAGAVSFSTIVAFGPNSSLPHYEPTNRKLADGECVLIDWGAKVDRYCSDLTRTFYPTSIAPALGKAFSAVREAHDRAIAVIKPGMKGSAVDKVARDHLRKAGYDKQFGHGLGHGIGLNIHEAPRLGKKSDDVLKPGMVVTIEPGVYLPGIGGVRLEDDVLITETGCEVLSSLPI
ncbi:MAG: M24 family metallopeptidase [Phycisphaerae bacterium]